MNEDPAIQAAYDAGGAYPARIAEIKNDLSLSELAKAEKISAAYQAHLAELERVRNDLHERRIARITHLQQQIPTGPGIPADASPADKAVLSAAFRTEYERARGELLAGKQAMLADGLKFGDDTRIRAVLTAADEAGHTTVLDDWARLTDHTDTLGELRTLIAQANGQHPASRPWEAQAFRAPQRPHEEINLHVIRQRAEQAAEKQAKADRFATPAYTRPLPVEQNINDLLGFEP